MLRLQVDASGELTVAAGAVRGRSAYLHARRNCVCGLLRSKGLFRSLRAAVDRQARQRVTDDLLKFVAGGSSSEGDSQRADEQLATVRSRARSVRHDTPGRV